MQETDKHLYIQGGILAEEPKLKDGLTLVSKNKDKILTPEQLHVLKRQHIGYLEQVAPDLKSCDLASRYAEALFTKLETNNQSTVKDLIEAGSAEFYSVGRYVLGPLAVAFVDMVMKDAEGIIVFPARDATPFFYIAKTLKVLKPEDYNVDLNNIINPVFNRKLWGVEDEQDPENEVLPISHPLVQKLLAQLGFGSKIAKSFVEVGCWGTMVDQLKRHMPHEQYSVYFLFTHLPDNIYGYINLHGEAFPEAVLETIADTWEAFPKFYKRQTKLIEHNGIVKASLEGKIIDSPFLPIWTAAALQGVTDAAKEFTFNRVTIDPVEEISRLWGLSQKAQQGEFTGVLPSHTETWSEGEQWKADWRWGKIPPLK